MRRLRQIVAAISFTLALLFICDMANFLPEWVSLYFIPKIQLIPAILAGSFITVTALILLSFVGGRIYCSVICPLGIFQDLIIRVSHWVRKKRKIKTKTEYKAPHHTLRYVILGLCTILTAAGSSFLVLLLDPYSIFSRFCSSLFQPVLISINNGISGLANAQGFYGINPITPHTVTSLLLAISLLTLAIIIYLSVKHQRLWCNTLCPAGTMLGLLSKYSIFKIRIDNEKCVSCQMCAKQCKSNTIDHNNSYTIDHSRCVSCFNCIDSCKKQAISYSPSFTRKKRKDASKK